MKNMEKWSSSSFGGFGGKIKNFSFLIDFLYRFFLQHIFLKEIDFWNNLWKSRKEIQKCRSNLQMFASEFEYQNFLKQFVFPGKMNHMPGGCARPWTSSHRGYLLEATALYTGSDMIEKFVQVNYLLSTGIHSQFLDYCMCCFPNKY